MRMDQDDHARTYDHIEGDILFTFYDLMPGKQNNGGDWVSFVCLRAVSFTAFGVAVFPFDHSFQVLRYMMNK